MHILGLGRKDETMDRNHQKIRLKKIRRAAWNMMRWKLSDGETGKAGLMALILLFVLGIQNSSGQRFLSRVFPEIDSVPDVVYGNAVDHQGKRVSLYFDFYEPHGDSLTQRPLLIYAHGGGFTGGSRKWPSIRMMCESLARKGYAVASISYRLNPEFNFFESAADKRAMTDAMHDMMAAIRFFKANREKYRVDTANIFIGGESAGAVTAVMAGYIDKAEELKAYPMAVPDDVDGSSGTPGYSTAVKSVLCLCGMIMDTSAIDSPQGSPLLFMHGTKDPLVSFAWADEIPQRAAHIGLPYKRIVYEGATHCPWYYSLSHWRPYLDSTVNYISHYMYSLVTGKEAPEIKKAQPVLRVANILQDNMVIQQDKPFRIWGASRPGDTVLVRADWLQQSVRAYAGKEGLWSCTVDVPKANRGDFAPHTITILNTQDTLTLSNLLIGEVWLCAGQSNMDMRVKKVPGYEGVSGYEAVIKAAEYPAIRVFMGSLDFKVSPQNEVAGNWKICSPETAGNFSAVAYFFGEKLFRELDIPVGLVVAAAAGAGAQAFTAKEVLLEDPVLKEVYWDPYASNIVSQARVDSFEYFFYRPPGGYLTKVLSPVLIYNAMIHPLEKLSIRGFVWYQGASNYSDGGHYARLGTAMVRNWRKNFNQGDLPFYFVQIAPFEKYADKCRNMLGLFWEAQKEMLKLKNTGMALSMDVGERENIHPRNKKPIGIRLAKLALRRDYGFTGMVDTGPELSKYKIRKNGRVEIYYRRSGIGSGLTTGDGNPPRYFSLAGDDRIFYPAAARITGNKVELYSEKVPHPVAVRYGFTKDAITNFGNKEGLPAFPFRTDDWTACP